VYFFRRAVETMARGPRVAVVATGTIFVALFVTGLFATSLQTAQRLIASWAGEVQISVYLDAAADLQAARAAVEAVAPGRAVEAVTSAEALRRFRTTLGPQGALLEGIKPEIFPPSVEVRAPGITFDEARALAAHLQAVPGAVEVDYGSAWLEPLQRFLGRLRWVAVALFVALAAGAAVLVANTLQLGVFARRVEIEIMRLVGATDLFVELPFLVEGWLQGLVGGALAAMGHLVTTEAVPPRRGWAAATVARSDVLPGSTLLGVVGVGAALGVIASALAVRRELKRRG
jgi:cell division transport system permease protein